MLLGSCSQGKQPVGRVYDGREGRAAQCPASHTTCVVCSGPRGTEWCPGCAGMFKGPQVRTLVLWWLGAVLHVAEIDVGCSHSSCWLHRFQLHDAQGQHCYILSTRAGCWATCLSPLPQGSTVQTSHASSWFWESFHAACVWARPVPLPLLVLASSCAPGSLLQALLYFSMVTAGQCKVIHSVSTRCLSNTKKKQTCNWLRETDVCLRLIWLCSFRRIVKVPLCCMESKLCSLLVFLPAYFCIKATDITFNFILVHEYTC